MEDDLAGVLDSQRLTAFQSTSSVWRTTPEYEAASDDLQISIHVLRMEDDGKNREKSLFALI